MNRIWNKKVFTFMVLFLAAGMVGTAIFDGWQNKWCWLAMVLPYLYVVWWQFKIEGVDLYMRETTYWKTLTFITCFAGLFVFGWDLGSIYGPWVK